MGSLYSKVTHVVNAYDKDIWTDVSGDQWYMKSVSDQGTLGNITPAITFMRYAQFQKIRRPNVLWRMKTKG
jgi:hypothetical protein